MCNMKLSNSSSMNYEYIVDIFISIRIPFKNRLGMSFKLHSYKGISFLKSPALCNLNWGLKDCSFMLIENTEKKKKNGNIRFPRILFAEHCLLLDFNSKIAV